jgi:hypothetical protein
MRVFLSRSLGLVVRIGTDENPVRILFVNTILLLLGKVQWLHLATLWYALVTLYNKLISLLFIFIGPFMLRLCNVKGLFDLSRN